VSLVALVFLSFGLLMAASDVHRTLTWDRLSAPISRCEGLDQRRPTCWVQIDEPGRSVEIKLSGWMGQPKVGDRVQVWVAPDRRAAGLAGWQALLDLVPIGVGAGMGAACFFPERLRRSRLLWGESAGRTR
jgi:hypothetical protein